MLMRKSQGFFCYLVPKVCCHCGARHNDEMDLCGTDYWCANRLRANEIVLLTRLLITIAQIF